MTVWTSGYKSEYKVVHVELIALCNHINVQESLILAILHPGMKIFGLIILESPALCEPVHLDDHISPKLKVVSYELSVIVIYQ